MLNGVKNTVPGNFFATIELEDIQTDSALADKPSRTLMLPRQTSRLRPDISKIDAPVAGCNAFSMENREFSEALIDFEDSDVCMAIVRVSITFEFIP